MLEVVSLRLTTEVTESCTEFWVAVLIAKGGSLTVQLTSPSVGATFLSRVQQSWTL